GTAAQSVAFPARLEKGPPDLPGAPSRREIGREIVAALATGGCARLGRQTRNPLHILTSYRCLNFLAVLPNCLPDQNRASEAVGHPDDRANEHAPFFPAVFSVPEHRPTSDSKR